MRPDPAPDFLRVALAAASEQARQSMTAPAGCSGADVCASLPCPCAEQAALATVTAFLLALPDRFPLPGRGNPGCAVWGATSAWHGMLALAVERAAANQGTTP